jgi:alkylglycerol monooxygenase
VLVVDATRDLIIDHLYLALIVAAGVAIAIEIALMRRWRRPVDYREVGESMVMGLVWIGARIVLGQALLIGVWTWTWQHASLFTLDVRSPWTWLGYWLIGDFTYYWTHRAEHRVRLLWSAHLVHHSSEQFNLATAVRQPWAEAMYKPVIALWAPLLGFHPVIGVVVGIASLAIGQWQHLDWFPKVRWLDAVVSSPSNHRVHHARNHVYLDRNFGGSLMVWDRLFGTYQPETEQPVYGVLHPPAATSLAGKSLGGLPELWAHTRAAAGLRRSVGVVFGAPR